MAERIVSPGVFKREQDLSYLAPLPAEVSTAVVGPAVKGPINTPTIVRSYSEYVSLFGDRFLSGSDFYQHMTAISAEKFFEQGGSSLLMTRVVDPADSWSGAEASFTAGAFVGATVPTATATVGTDFGVDADFEFQVEYDNTTYRFIYSDPRSGIPASQSPIFFLETGSTQTEALDNLENAFNKKLGLDLSLSYVGSDITVTATTAGATYNGTALTTVSASVTSSAIELAGGAWASVPKEYFVLETFGKGDIFNSSGSVASDGSVDVGNLDNFRVELGDVDAELGVFDLYIRRGDDTNTTPVYLETFSNVSLDPNSDNYISAIIGDVTHEPVLDPNTGEYFMQELGEYANRSNYVRVKSVGVQQPDYFTNAGEPKTAYAADLTTLSTIEGTIPFVGGVGSVSPAGAKFFHEIDGENVEGLGVASNEVSAYNVAANLLRNTEAYNFEVISTPGLNQKDHASTIGAFIDLAEDRSDCIYIVDPVPYGALVSDAAAEAKEINSSYASAYWPWVKVQTQGLGKQVWAPASVMMPGVYSFSDSVSDQWFAPAGLVRGGIPGVVKAERKLSRSDRDTLYSAKVNPLATFPGQGVVAYGQKTLQTKASAMDRVNVRRLLINLKRFIGNQANTLVFEQNSIATRNRFLSAVNPYLDNVVQREGLYAYRVVMDDTNNTADVVDRNMLIGQVYIQPTKTAEFIVLDFTVEPTGASFQA